MDEMAAALLNMLPVEGTRTFETKHDQTLDAR